jgi:hypothetical protein
MLLCEVAVGKSKELYQAENVENLPSTFKLTIKLFLGNF